MARALTDEDLLRFRRMYEAGVSNRDLAKEFGRKGSGWATVQASRLGLSPRYRSGPRASFTDDDLVRLRQEGLSVRQGIPEALGVSPDTVRNRLHALGLAPDGDDDPATWVIE